jgi:plasmid stability protein
MSQVLVRKLPDSVVELLRARAATAGRSLEQELRLILIEAAQPARTRLKDVASGLRGQLAAERSVDTLDLLRAGREP